PLLLLPFSPRLFYSRKPGRDCSFGEPSGMVSLQGFRFFHKSFTMGSVAAVVRDVDAPESSKLDQAARGGERASRRRLRAGAQIGAGLLLFGIVLLAVSRDWRHVHATLSRISAWELVLSELLVLAGLGASVLVWQRALQELGSRVRAAAASKIYLIGQLGKYLPGSVWAFFAQMEL